MGATVLDTQRPKEVREVGANSFWNQKLLKKNNLNKYIKSRNYFQFNISNTLNTSLAGGITIRTGCQFPDLLCKLHLELDPLLTLHGNVTSSHFLQVEDKGEKLPVLKLLSVSGIIWGKNMSP